MPGTSTYGTPIPLDTDPAGDLALAQRNIVDSLEAGWTAYTPVWTATTTNPVIGNGTLQGKYKRIGKTVLFRVKVVMGSTTTYGSGQMRWSLPFAPHADYVTWASMQGNGYVQDTSAPSNLYRNLAAHAASAGCFLTDDAGNQLSAVVPFTFANGDTIYLAGAYEAA
jgi:hypothetical protein